jgi:hypothetical protein
MKQLRKMNWLLAAMVAGMVILILAGLGLLGAYFYLSREAGAQIAWTSPLDGVHAQAVAPDLAALSLAGEPDDRVIRAALDAGEVETAYAGLAYSVLLPDSLRSGLWLLLSDRLAKTDSERAAVTVQAALDIAALGPSLGDMARADISLQAAARFATEKRAPAAKLALAQAESIARYSPILLPAQRRSILERVEAAYRATGDDGLAQSLRRDLDVASAGPGAKVEPPAPLLPALRGGIKLPPSLAVAIGNRQQAAAQMAARWLSAAPSARAAMSQALGQALLAEDAARAEFYATAADVSADARLPLLHDRIAWLTIKYRVARGAFGVDLVPEWANQVEAIRGELVTAHTDLINGYGQQLDTLAIGDASQARVELLRQGLLASRLGLFPEANAEAVLSDQLLEASRDLWTRQGGVGLVNMTQDVDGLRFYLLAGADARRTPSTQMQ